MAADSSDGTADAEAWESAGRENQEALLGVDPRLKRAPIGETAEQRRRRRAAFRVQPGALGIAGQASASVDASGFPVIETRKGPLCIDPWLMRAPLGETPQQREQRRAKFRRQLASFLETAETGESEPDE